MKITDLKTYTVLPTYSAPVEKKKKTVGQKVLDVGTGISNFFGGKGVADTYGATIAKIGKTQQEKDIISSQQPTVKQTVGSGLQLGANLIPGAGEVGLAGKVALGVGTGYAMDVGSKLQNNEKNALTPGVGTVIGGGLPLVGAVRRPATKVIGRLLKGLGSGLSGVSTETIDRIVNNPETAQKASQQLAKSGNNRILEKNARTIVNGVSKIRQEARQGFGQAMSELKQEDVDPKKFRNAIQPSLDKIGSVTEGNTRKLQNIEFKDPANLKRANSLINEISNTKLDGLSLRKLVDKIENTKFKTATSDERLSFNAFTKDLASSVKEAINGSTDKLQEANAKFSGDMQLAEATQNIFGKVNFKNLPEVVRASQKLEGLFAQKGLAPEVVDDFLSRIGVSPNEFKTTEAVRQISNKEAGTNSVGTSFGEVMRSVTSAVVTPSMVKDLSIVTGMTKEKLVPFLRGLKPGARNILIQALLQSNQDSSQSNQQ